MTNARKFEFGLSFDGPGAHGAARAAPPPAPVAIEPEAPPAPSFTDADVEAARHQGRLEGRAEGEADAMMRTERWLAETAERLARDVEKLIDGQELALVRIERQAATLLVEAIRRLFPALLQRSGVGEIEALVMEVLRSAHQEPRLAIRCAPEDLAAVQPMLDRLATRTGFEGKLSLLGDPDLTGSQCRIEWSDGGLDRDPGRLLTEIEAAVTRGLDDFDRRHGSDGAETLGVLEESRP